MGAYDSLTTILGRNFEQTLSRYSDYVGKWTKSSYVLLSTVFSVVESQLNRTKIAVRWPMLPWVQFPAAMWYFLVGERVWLGATTIESPEGKKEILLENIINLGNEQSGNCATTPHGTGMEVNRELKIRTPRQQQRYKFCTFFFLFLCSSSPFSANLTWPFLKFFREREHTAVNSCYRSCAHG